MAKKHSPTLPVAAKEIRFTLDLPAPAAKAWKALTKGVHQWWPSDFLAAGAGSRIILEPRLDGKLYEDAGQGNGLIWYRVIALDAPNSILLSGVIAPPFGGPATTLLRLTLTEAGTGKSSLQIHDALFGHIDGCDVEAGWRMVFGAFAESLK